MKMSVIKQKAAQAGIEVDEESMEIFGHYVSIDYGAKLTISAGDLHEGSLEDAIKMQDELTTMLAMFSYMHGAEE